MSNRLFQGIIHQMRDTIDRTIGVVDESSVIIACSELGKIGEVCEEITPEEMASVDVFQTDEYSFKSFGSRPRPGSRVQSCSRVRSCSRKMLLSQFRRA